jgi:hypothetical protein
MRPVAALLLLYSFAACSGTPSRSGLAEPIRVREGVFHQGSLVGGDAPSQVTAFEYANGIISWEQAGKSLVGRTTADAYAVAIRFLDLGTGSWVVPVGAIDPTANGERIWSLTADFGRDIPPGPQRLQLVPIAENGVAGRETQFEICVLSDLPDNLATCDSSRSPPAAVVSLVWDSEVDLDLVVQTPEGKIVDWRHPSTVLATGGRIDSGALKGPTVGILNRNSNADCVIDSIRREDLVWQGTPLPGTWKVYANLFSACGQPAVSFRAAVYRVGAAGGLVEDQQAAGQLGALAANGGTRLGLLLLEVAFP